MKTYHLKRTATASLIVSALCIGAIATQAQQPAPGQSMTLEVATAQSDAFALNNIIGKPLRSSNQQQLSTIADFLVDPSTGRLHFAVAPSGAGPSGETYRIIPMAALQATPMADAFTVQLDRAQWQQVGTMIEPRLQGRINIDEQHQQRLTQQFGLAGQPVDIGGAAGLIRASQLQGREIRSAHEQFGTIEDVVIDLHNKIAAPMLKPTSASTAGVADQKFLVPFERLQITDAQGAITTNLTQADFRQLQGGLTPTGHPSAIGQPSGQFGANQPVMAAAIAVRQALNQDHSLRGNVHVVPESRIVLQGSVENEQKKAQVEHAARQAAQGVRIDNQLTVRSW